MNKNQSITDDFNTQVQCEEVYTEEGAEISKALPPDVRHIDLTPTWETAVNICITILESSAKEEAKETCRQELRRLAKHVDEQQQK